MKTIIVPTDFSAAANNAMQYAGQFAEKIGATILLVNVYQIPISMNDVPVMMVTVEELKNNAEASLEKTKELLQKRFPTLKIKTESRLGDVVDEVEDVCIGARPVAIIVGKRNTSGMERVLFGSTTLSLVKHLTVPIISVPDNISECKLDQVALAVDSSGIQSQESVIARFLQLLPMRLHIVHINEKEADDTNLEKMLPQVNAVHRTMKAEEFATGIEIYVEQNNIDLLIVLPHKHNFLERLFFSQHTDELLQKIKIPMMCIPEQ